MLQNRPHKKASIRTIVVNLFVLGCSLLLTVIVSEIILGLFFDIHYSLVYEPDPQLGWKHIPGARRHYLDEGDGMIQINSAGLRDRERQIDKPPYTYRIGIFGDSMTEAAQVNLEQTFCYLLEESLQDEDHNVEVLNFGVSAYSPINELLQLRQEGTKYALDLTVLAVFLDNDVSGCLPVLSLNPNEAPFITVVADNIIWDFSSAEENFIDYHREPFYTLRKHSRIYRLISKYRHLRNRQNEVVFDFVPKRYRLYQVPLRPEWSQAWINFERIVYEIYKETQRQGQKLVILSVPASQVVSKHAWHNVLELWPAMKELEWDLEYPDRRLKVFCDKHQIPLIQTNKEFALAAKKAKLFFGNVGHMTPEGHELMGTILKDSLGKLGVLPY